MAKNINKERFFGNMEDLKQESHVGSGDGYENMTAEERRRARVRNHYSRQPYRRFGVGQNLSYASVVFRETLIAIFAAAFYGMYVITFIFGVGGLLYATRFSATLTVVLVGAVIAAVGLPVLRRILRRVRFMKHLVKLAERESLVVTIYRSPLRSLYRDGGCPDFAVECGGRVYECMFFPCRRRLTVLKFEQPGRVKIVTGIVKNRFKEALSLRERVRERDFGFEVLTPADGRDVVKTVILNPVPYRLFCLDKRDGFVAEGGSGSEAFGYRFFNASGFLSEIERNAGQSDGQSGHSGQPGEHS